MFTVEHHRGRLIETRLSTLASVDEVQQFAVRFRQVASEVTAPQIVICGDYRAVRVFAPEVAEKFCAMLVAANPRVERSAVLVDAQQAVAVLQLERTLKQANNPSRRAFRSVPEAAAWLAEVLDADETKRLHDFLRG